ncbi:hypothetical protein [Sporolactobacillus laevolacticus]|uniref:Uncharacterized protein n=1 Tax=Sporolactobacillus laevolacticus DSM 442 TaxID=1395513 RepID=V6IZ94_9BACL|nr:hypothetical protein [Sporolactobacillus laevolacticus]EST12770.1 hypothetical protein P343_05940 [Sporolactobacillus laevolacticus DSM 442]
MNTYQFYIEYDGRRTVSSAYETPIETVIADTIDQAAGKFAEKNKLKNVKVDHLDEGDYRVFLEKKNLLGKTRELVYFVREG